MATVIDFQRRHRLGVDGVAGKQTLGKLDELLPTPGPLPPSSGPIAYVVPGLKVLLAQPSSMSCWATVYTMLRSWRDGVGYGAATAVGLVGATWTTFYNNSFPPNPTGLPAAQFDAFIRAANMRAQPVGDLHVRDWCVLLRSRRLLWIGASVTINPGIGLHSRMLEDISGDGTPGGTRVHIMDPAGGRRYTEAFVTFQQKYESGVMSVGGQYLQIRHF